ncbi:MAG TPA: winged helix-turn-helix transcriptional regulator [Vicinamibacterales bacterium]|nr:winged helix-turn-helix transcriptional regulator [Vicinamibacterales bacterium]
MDMDVESRRELQVLEAVEQDRHITQRNLAAKLGVALGLTNIYLKRLIHKGYIKCVNVQSNRLLYLITPQGIAEKSRLTYEFMDYSLFLYRQVRQHLRHVLQPCRDEGVTRIAIYGIGEAAELAYLSIKEQGLELLAVFTDKGGGTFLGMPIQSIDDYPALSVDRLIVATLENSDTAVRRLLAAGVLPETLLMLKPTDQMHVEDTVADKAIVGT